MIENLPSPPIPQLKTRKDVCPLGLRFHGSLTPLGHCHGVDQPPQHPPLHLGERRGADGHGQENTSSSGTSSQTCTSFLFPRAWDQRENRLERSRRQHIQEHTAYRGKEAPAHLLPLPLKKKRHFWGLYHTKKWFLSDLRQRPRCPAWAGDTELIYP